MNQTRNTERQHFLEITDEDKLLDTCIALKNIGREHQSDFLRDAIRNREYYLGNQYLRQVGDRFEYRRRTPGNEWRPQTVRNVIGQTVDSNHAVISSAAPKTNIVAINPEAEVMYNPEMPTMENLMMGQSIVDQMVSTGLSGRETGVGFTDYLERVWNSPYRKEHQARAMTLLDSMMIGTAFRGYGIRDHPYRGREVIVKELQPHQLLIDPEARDMVTFSDCRWIIGIANMDVMTIKRRYKADESQYGQRDNNVYFDATSQGGYISRLFKRQSVPLGDGRQDETVTEEWSLRKYPVFMLYFAGWMPDLMTINSEMGEDPEDFPYPNGRLVTWINDMKIVEDRNIETWGFTFPFVGFTPHPTPHTAYGQSDVARLIGPQDIINAFSNIIVSNAILNGHTQLLVEAGAIDPRTFSVRPGAIMQLAQDALRNGRVKQLFPGPLGGEILQYMLNLEHWTKEELGDANSILGGNTPGTVRSGVHARTVTENAYVGKSFTIGLLDDSYELCAFKEAALTQQYVPLNNNYNKGYMNILDGMDLAMQNLIYKVELESQKHLPFSAGGQFEMYFAMLHKGDINHKEFFELTKIHISEEWREKVDQAAKDAMPGIPPEVMAQQQMASNQQVGEAASIAQQLGAGGGLPPGTPTGTGQSQSPQSDMQVSQVEQL